MDDCVWDFKVVSHGWRRPRPTVPLGMSTGGRRPTIAHFGRIIDAPFVERLANLTDSLPFAVNNLAACNQVQLYGNTPNGVFE